MGGQKHCIIIWINEIAQHWHLGKDIDKSDDMGHHYIFNPNKRKLTMPRKYSPKSRTWRMFVTLFLELEQDKYPFIIPNLTKGKAVNLAQGLNGCQRYWAMQQGVPDGVLQRSAKAKEGDLGMWFVEISDSPKHTNTRKGGLWLTELMLQIEDTVAPAKNFTKEYTTQDTVKPESESVFEKWLTNAPAQTQSGVDEGTPTP